MKKAFFLYLNNQVVAWYPEKPTVETVAVWIALSLGIACAYNAPPHLMGPAAELLAGRETVIGWRTFHMDELWPGVITLMPAKAPL